MGTSLSMPKLRRSKFNDSSRVSKKEKEKEKEKERYMLLNGGFLLEELLRSCDGKCSPFRIFSAKELAEATNDYDRPYISDSFFMMYRGFFGGHQIFVKSMSADSNFGNNLEMAINDVVFASQLNNHKNILMLLGCCLETEIPMLVFEPAENGALSDHIFKPSTGLKNHQVILPWDCRLKVAKETADALAYLHTGLSTPIVHRNVKPTNIYLDGNYVAKLSDFTLSVSIPSGEEFVETDEVIGTRGFVAPEYIETAKLTVKCDVYSYGSLLIEMLSGESYWSLLERFNNLRGSSPSESDLSSQEVNHSNQDISNANDFLEVHLSHEELSNVNQRAVYPTYFFQSNIFLAEYKRHAIMEAAKKYVGAENILEGHSKQLTACTELALKCHRDSPEERPTMKEVAQELRRIITFQHSSS